MLFFNKGDLCSFFLNGEVASFSAQSAELLKELSDKRQLISTYFTSNQVNDTQLFQQLYVWYLSGYLQLDTL